MTDPAQVYGTLLARPISKTMKANAIEIRDMAMRMTRDEPLMRGMLDDALKNASAFIRGVELLKFPEVTAWVPQVSLIIFFFLLIFLLLYTNSAVFFITARIT